MSGDVLGASPWLLFQIIGGVLVGVLVCSMLAPWLQYLLVGYFNWTSNTIRRLSLRRHQ